MENGKWKKENIIFNFQLSIFNSGRRPGLLPGKEMFHPQVLLRIPCYDLVPISNFTVVPPQHLFDVSNFLQSIEKVLGKGASGAPAFHDLTGGEYKTQEHIHRDVADSRLLAIPTS